MGSSPIVSTGNPQVRGRADRLTQLDPSWRVSKRFTAAPQDLVVGLEEIDIQPGPDYDVFIAPGADRDDSEGGIRLDDLRGNMGSQFYEVPADVEIGGSPWTVLVWCETFGVPIANATPA